jgi:hypothetical protein
MYDNRDDRVVLPPERSRPERALSSERTLAVLRAPYAVGEA